MQGTEKVQIQIPHCAGVTSFGGRHYAADKDGMVTVPRTTADALKKGGAVRSARRVFGGFNWPPQPKAE